MNTAFSGIIQDSDYGSGGAMTKMGNGIFVLSGNNTYTGGTTVNSGTLIVSGSVLGLVTVNHGTLTGPGTVGAVTIAHDGTLAPDSGGAGIFNVTGNLSLATDSHYVATFDGIQFSQTSVSGSVNLGSATLSFKTGNLVSSAATYMLINNGGAGPVIGTFKNLGEGKTIKIGNRSLKISYVGGDGNDVVLTALP